MTRCPARGVAGRGLVAAVPLGHPLLNRIGPLKLTSSSPGRYRLSQDTTAELRGSGAVAIPGSWDATCLPARSKRASDRARLVAAGIGVCLVPECVQQLRRGDVIYRALEDEQAVHPSS